MATATSTEPETVADLLEQLQVPPERILLRPPPGEATEKDLLKSRRMCELIDGVLVEKAMGYYESRLGLVLAVALETFMQKDKLGVVFGDGGLMRVDEAQVRIPDVCFLLLEQVSQAASPTSADSQFRSRSSHRNPEPKEHQEGNGAQNAASTSKAAPNWFGKFTRKANRRCVHGTGRKNHHRRGWRLGWRHRAARIHAISERMVRASRQTSVKRNPTMATATSTEPETVADLLEQLHVPPERIMLRPPPGKATEKDLLKSRRLCELIDGVLVEKAMGFYESRLAVVLIYHLGEFREKAQVGDCSR